MRKRSYTRNVGVLLSEDLYQQVVSITDRMEITISEFIRNAVEEECKKSEREEQDNEQEDERKRKEIKNKGEQINQ